MDTTQAINILETESLNLGVDINTKTNLQAALELAVQQLKGTLQTQLAELEATKEQLTALQAAPLETPPTPLSIQ